MQILSGCSLHDQSTTEIAIDMNSSIIENNVAYNLTSLNVPNLI